MMPGRSLPVGRQGKGLKQKSIKQTMEANTSVLTAMCTLAGKPAPEWLGKPTPACLPDLPTGQAGRQAKPSSKTVTQRGGKKHAEAPVVAAVASYLYRARGVLFAVRQNSGMAYNTSNAPVYFYRFVRGREMRLTDFWGLTTAGKMFAIECKRPGWKKPSGLREAEQYAFLETVKSAGGIGMFVTDVSDLFGVFDA